MSADVAVRRKVCLLGDVGVGKTSLVTRFVHGGYSPEYLTTVGVKIDTRLMQPSRGKPIKLVIWDIAGTDALASIDHAYTRGAAAWCLVGDGTRPDSLRVALQLHAQLQERLGELPFVALLNKRDLIGELVDQVARSWRTAGVPFVTTSALTGENVAFAFDQLALQLAVQ